MHNNILLITAGLHVVNPSMLSIMLKWILPFPTKYINVGFNWLNAIQWIIAWEKKCHYAKPMNEVVRKSGVLFIDSTI